MVAYLKSWLLNPYLCFKQLFQVRCICAWVVYCRYFYLVFFRRRMRTYSGVDLAQADTLSHNLKKMRMSLSSQRSLLLIRPLSVMEVVGPLNKADVLCVGPRSEAELIQLWAHGFKFSRIKGLDLISYSPWVTLGDMHKMPWPDNSFDVVLTGWTLAYSKDARVAAKEIVRVLRPGGLVAAAAGYTVKSDEEIAKELGYTPCTGTYFRSVDDILDRFGTAVDEVYFRHGLAPGKNDENASLLAIFSVQKDEPISPAPVLNGRA